MSLINQMLKDLEKRRADGVSETGSPLKGVTRYSAVGGNNAKHTALLVAIFILLAALLSFVGWQYWLKDAANEPLAQAPTTTPTVKQAEKSGQAKTQNTARSAPTRPAKSAKSKPAAKSSKKATNTGGVKKQARARTFPVNETDIEDDGVMGEPGQVLQKQRRPLKPRQKAELAYKKGYTQLQRGRVEAGEVRLREALKAYPAHIRAREMLAGVYIKAGRYVEAGELLHRGIELAPDHRIFAKLYARVLLEQDNLNLAVRVLEQRLPAIQSDPDYYAFLAALYQRQGEHFKAASRYRDILKLRPSMGVWWIGLGISLEKLDKTEEAKAAYERARSTGALAANLVKYTDNRLAALRDIGFPED